MTVREEEKVTLGFMMDIYCRGNHQKGGLCPECLKLQEYAFARTDRCVWKDEKPACSKCTVHCYSKENRDSVKKVMRFSGPRMLLHHPIRAIKHLLK